MISFRGVRFTIQYSPQITYVLEKIYVFGEKEHQNPNRQNPKYQKKRPSEHPWISTWNNVNIFLLLSLEAKKLVSFAEKDNSMAFIKLSHQVVCCWWTSFTRKIKLSPFEALFWIFSTLVLSLKWFRTWTFTVMTLSHLIVGPFSMPRLFSLNLWSHLYGKTKNSLNWYFASVSNYFITF